MQHHEKLTRRSPLSRSPGVVDWKQTIRRKITKFAVLLLVSSNRPDGHGIARKPQFCAKSFSVFVPRPQLQRESSIHTRRIVCRQQKQAWPDQEIIRRQAFLREAAPCPLHGEDERAVPRLRGRSCQAAGVRRSGRPEQHAMADSSGGQSQRQNRRQVPIAYVAGRVLESHSDGSNLR
jgi:hypothetical protein